MDSLASRLLAAKAQLQLQRPRIVLLGAQSGLALVTLRIQRDGLPGETYSTNPLPRFYFKPINAGGRAYVRKDKAPNYRGFRAASGLPSDRVTLTFTGRTIRSLQPVPSGTRGAVSSAQVVASDMESAKIVGYWQRDYGVGVLDPNPQERATVQQVMQREMDRVIQQALNGN